MRRAWKWGILAAAGLPWVVAFAFWPRTPALELFTSKWFPDGKGKVRYQFLKPKGWVESPEPGYYLDLCDPSSIWQGDHGATINLDTGYIMIVPDLTDKGHSANVTVRKPEGRPWEALRRDGSSDFVILYSYPRHSGFNATYRQICESFRVIREK